MYDQSRESPAHDTVRSLLPVTFIGLFIVLIALVFMQWPVPTGKGVTDHQISRMTGFLSGANASLPGFLLDALVYILLLVGIGCIVIAWRRAWPGPLLALTLVGLLGLAYVSGTALYTGPMISVCGFSMVLFGGLVAWVAVPFGKDKENEKEQVPEPVAAPEQQAQPPEPSAEVNDTNETGETSGTNETGETSDYASHSVT